ncbi:hypothetical protein ACFLUD_01255 [Chloroflexota bacterium]
MLVKTRIFKLCDGKYENLSKLAQAMEISVSQVYRVREGKRSINQKFIVGAIKAFPGHKLDDLFYLVPESPAVTYHLGSVMLPQMSQLANRNREGKALSKY